MSNVLENFKRNDVVTLAIPAARPIMTLDGNLHQARQTYKVLGFHGTCVRLSRISDHAKLIIDPASLLNVAGPLNIGGGR